MTKEIEETPLPRVQVAAFIPEALRVAITAYHARAGADAAGLTAKEFAEHQKACHAAVAHIELLVKLALRAELPEADEDTNRQAVTAALLRQAAEDVRAFEGAA